MLIINIIVIRRKKRIEKEIKKLIKMTMEVIILIISWHYKTMKRRIIININENNIYNSNNNDLKV